MTGTRADVVVVGAGTSGATLAGLLVDAGLTVICVEAGPDYGPRTAGRWPAELLDARRLPESHGWGHAGPARPSHAAPTAYERARVVGGCSSHNGCVALAGTRADYDRWAEQAGETWSWVSVRPAFARVKARLRVAAPAVADLQPFQRAFVAAAFEAGVPASDDLDDPDEAEGVGASPVNIVDGVRWNAAFAYLDPVRASGRLTMVAEALADRVVLRHGRAVGIEVVTSRGRETISADLVVLAAGAYESPAVLMRSGIGAPAALQAAGIEPRHELPGVGEGLVDHPLHYLEAMPSPAMVDRMAAAEAAPAGWVPEEQALAKLRLPGRPEPVAVHVFPWTPPAGGGRRYRLAVALMAPVSAGRVRVTSADPAVRPLVDHGYLADAGGCDRRGLVDAVLLGRHLLDRLVERGDLLPDGATPPAGDALVDVVEAGVSTYYHPAGSCRMGEGDAAVVDPAGRVRGIDGLRVVDASIFPALPRANTNLPAAMVAEHLAPAILAG